MPRPELGSIISGTLRPRDVLHAFANTLEALDHAGHYAPLIRESRTVVTESEDGREVLGELESALGEMAPAYCYFGAHPGDGADFGYWPDWDAINADRRDRTLLSGNELPENDSGGAYFLHISDHGNAELYEWDSASGRWRSLWGVV